MIKNVMFIIFTLLVLMPLTTAPAQTTEESIQNAGETYSEWIRVMAEITKSIEFNERDIQNFLEYWSDLEQLDIGDMDDEDPIKFRNFMDSAVKDQDYQGWANARNLDPEGFLKNSIRISSMFLLKQAAMQEAVLSQAMKKSAEMIEEQCSHAEPITCDEMKKGLEATKKMLTATVKANQQLRPPSASERELLDRYSSELETVMMDESEEDEFDEEDFYGGEEEFYEHED